MTEKLNAVVKESLVRIFSARSHKDGIGFCLSPNIILTSFSFINIADSLDFQVSSLDFLQKTKAIFQGCYQKNFDLAILHCNIPISAKCLLQNHYRLLSNCINQSPKIYDEVITYGYKKDSSELIQVKARYKGRVSSRDNYKLIQFSLEDKNVDLATGLPLIDASSNRLYGINISSYQNKDNKLRETMENELAWSITEDYSNYKLVDSLCNHKDFGVAQDYYKNLTSAASATSLVRKNNINVQDARSSGLIIKLRQKYQDDLVVPCSNVKFPTDKEFIGRAHEIEEIIKRISDDFREHIVVIEGINGIGKTALVKKVANICYKNSKKKNTIDGNISYDKNIPYFDAIISITANQIYSNIISYSRESRTEPILQKIFRIIAKTIKSSKILKAKGKKQLDVVYDQLKKQKTLLIIDNLESIDSENRQHVLAFLANLPITTKVVLTSRFQMDNVSYIRLSELSKEDSLKLITQKEKYKKLNLTNEEKERIANSCQGIPVALTYAVGRKKAKIEEPNNSTLKSISPEKLVYLSFEYSIDLLRETPAFEILRALVIFQDPPCRDALLQVAGLHLENVTEDLTLLENLAFIQKRNNKFYMLATTREYMLTELAKYPEFEADARDRWIEWYLDYTRKYGGKDGSEWREKSKKLDRERENIFSVLHWCSSQDLYHKALELWQNIDTYIDLSSYWQIRRYWWKWLVKESDRRADIPTYVKAISERAWTLTLMDSMNLEYQHEAKIQFAEAFRLHKYSNPETQMQLFIYIAVHRLINRKYKKAFYWLDIAEKYLAINESYFEEHELERFNVLTNYHKAENIYWKQYSEKNILEGFESKKELKRAREIFETILKQTQKIQWERYGNYAKNWLGRICIDEGDLKAAENYLIEGLSEAINNDDNSRIGYFCDTYSSLEKKRNNLDKSNEFKEIAKHFFEKEDIAYS